MLRGLVASAILICPFAASSFAEPITLRRDARVLSPGLQFNVADLAFRAAVIAATAEDWRETSGTDVWWMDLEDMKLLVQVFSTLERPGSGEPQCCLSFVSGDTEFWLKIRGVFSQKEKTDSHTSGKNTSDGAPRTAGSSPGDTPQPLAPPSTGGPTPPPQKEAPGVSDGNSDDGVERPPLTGGSAGTGGSNPGGGSTGGGTGKGTPSPVSGTPSGSFGTDAPSHDETAAAQIPEPGMLLLLGIGLVAAAARIRKAR